MKINDKHLCDVAIGSTPTDKQGFLYKRGEVNRAFQRRWFVLKGNLLFYFDRPNDREPIGVVVLDNCSVEQLECDDEYAFQLSFAGSGARTYVLAAACQEEMEDWLRALTCANYDYIRAAVAQLQRQLDDLNSLASSSRSVDPRGPVTGRIAKLPVLNMIEASAVCAALSDLDITTTSTSNLLVDLSESQLPESSKARSFEEMHRDFGVYFSKK